MLADGPASRLFVRDGARIVPLRTGTVERLEACDDFVQVFAGGRSFRVNLPMHEIKGRLDPAVFVRIHRSHIVNLDHVVGWTPYDGSRIEVRLRSGAVVMASRQRSRLLRQLTR